MEEVQLTTEFVQIIMENNSLKDIIMNPEYLGIYAEFNHSRRTLEVLTKHSKIESVIFHAQLSALLFDQIYDVALCCPRLKRIGISNDWEEEDYSKMDALLKTKKTITEICFFGNEIPLCYEKYFFNNTNIQKITFLIERFSWRIPPDVTKTY